MVLLTPHRFTVEDYHRMAETGVLAPDARVELLDGEIIDMPPIGPLHGGATNRLAEIFIQRSNGRWFTSIQTPLRLSQRSEPQPDLMLLRPRADGYSASHPAPEDVLVLIEVSDSTLDHDRSRKLPIYGKAGVPEVWIINLGDSTVEIYREPHYLGYETSAVHRAGDKVSPAAFPDLKLDVDALLRRAR